MYLTVINPTGGITSLDLTAFPSVRLELAATKAQGDNGAVAIGMRYPTGAGGSAFAIICALNCKVPLGEVEAIATPGLPCSSRTANKERLRESFKVLYNSASAAKAVEELVAASAKLVDCYHDILEACWGGLGGDLAALQATGPAAKGELEGWRWALTKTRFCPIWGAGGAAAEGMGMAPLEASLGAPPVARTPKPAPAEGAEPEELPPPEDEPGPSPAPEPAEAPARPKSGKRKPPT
jgi:hypothetical protein